VPLAGFLELSSEPGQLRPAAYRALIDPERTGGGPTGRAGGEQAARPDELMSAREGSVSHGLPMPDSGWDAGVITRVLAGGGLQISPSLVISEAQLEELPTGLQAGLNTLA
jgi:hypothetical protein